MVRPIAISHPARDGARIEPGRLGVRRRGPHGLEIRPDDLAPGARRFAAGTLEVWLDRVDHGDAASLEVGVENVSDHPVELDAVVVGVCFRTMGEGGLRFLRHGWQSWSPTESAELGEAAAPFPSGPWLRGMYHSLGEPPADRADWHESEIVSLVAGSAGGPACLAGVAECGESFGVLYLRSLPASPAERAGQCVEIDVELRLEVPLEPGESRALEPIRLALGDDPGALLEHFAELWGRGAGARRGAGFQAGWCSWYHYFHRVSEQDVLRNLEALAADRSGIPIELVQLDDGFQRAIGDWLETNERFPRGLAPVAEEIRSAGFTAGLWTAPFAVSDESRLLPDHEDWLLRSEGERLRGTHNPEWSKSGWVYVLDPSRLEVLRHLEWLFASLTGLGFDYLKLDFLYMPAMQAQGFDPGLGRAARLRAGLQAIRSGAGDEAFLLGCGCPLGPAVGIVDGMRIGPDVAPSWEVDSPIQIPGLERMLPSTRSAIRSTLLRAFTHRRLWLNDPDCLMARERDTRLSAGEARSLAAAISVTGGMTVFSDDVALLGDDERKLIARTISQSAVVDAAASAAGHGVTRLSDPLAASDPRAISADLGRDRFLAVINMGEEPATLAADDALALEASELAPHESATGLLRGARELAIFCDFDGTFSVRDVGSTIAQRELPERRVALTKRFRAGELDAWEYAEELFGGFAWSVSQLDDFLETIELDPGARGLLAWCREGGVRFRILSDGFDHNLDRLQEIHGVSFEHSANHLEVLDGGWRISPGHRNPDCACGTGSCKRALIEAWRRAHPASFCVHIGNGRVSDLCGALAADQVFAKDTLAPALAERGVAYEPFRTLDDVVAILDRAWGDTPSG
jgi:alpha-galactosidase